MSRSLRWNSRKESVKLKWKEVESRRMNYDNLLWRRKLIQDATEQTKLMAAQDLDTRIQKFGSSSTALMVASESRRGLERTLSHTSTRVSTSAKVAVRKIRGGGIRGMKVLAYMNSPKWNTMDRPAREQAIQCPCEGDIQDIKHVATECSYMVEHMDEMKVAVSAALQTEPDEAAQRKWLSATSTGE